MSHKILGYTTLLLLILTNIWLILLIWGIGQAGQVETFEQALNYVARADWRYFLSYANASLLTIVATIWVVCLYLYCRPDLPEWLALIGLIFTPIYCVLNIFAYLSQITAVPLLLSLHENPVYRASAEVALALLIQQWPGSTIAFLNGLAYAMLGIPSIVFGIALRSQGRAMNLAGILLILNGMACILGVVGGLIGSKLLSLGSLAGGGLFFVGLIPMSWALIKKA
jgi:hypothetical protein